MDGIGSPDLVSVLWSFSSPAMPARPPSHIKLFLWRRLTVLVVRIKRHLVGLLDERRLAVARPGPQARRPGEV